MPCRGPSTSDPHIDALEVVVDVLSGVENDAAPEAFYGRLCEAVCQVTSMIGR